MSEDQKPTKTLSLGAKTLSLKPSGTNNPTTPAAPKAAAPVRSGYGNRVAVEVVKKRASKPNDQKPTDHQELTDEERQSRSRALELAKQAEIERAAEEAKKEALRQQQKLEAEKLSPEEEQRQKELAELEAIQQAEKPVKAEKVEAEPVIVANEEVVKESVVEAPKSALHKAPIVETEEDRIRRANVERQKAFIEKYEKTGTPPPVIRGRDEVAEKAEKEQKAKRGAAEQDRRRGKLTVTQVLNDDFESDRRPSLAAQRRAREKRSVVKSTASKVYREVIVPEAITVQELANRMTERSGDVVKALMKMGVMATMNQVIDADTAELLVSEFGHTVKRIQESDVVDGLLNISDDEGLKIHRPPVVTIMGHVDHGKTSLLDALRQTDVVSGEAGGITQHIGAYQITVSDNQKITFLDTPGHAAFTEMRARGANVTDIVVLVVSAADGLMPQTIEAINHSKAAGVPIIVAINKIDLPDAKPAKVREMLLQHEVVVEEMGGDTQCVEVSAKKKINLDKLEEAILLQAEILELKANPDREASGTVIESKMERGRGNVASVLIQNGTLRIGNIFAVGSQWGRVRAIINDRGQNIKEAIPGQPVEILGLNGTPEAGDAFNVVENEARAREIAEYRHNKRQDAANLKIAGNNTMEQMMARAREGEKQILPVLIKADVHGSVEAIAGTLDKITEDNNEVAVKALHTGVGGITESDVTLAKASNAMIIGFNVRANAQARKLAEQEGVEIRYYSIIYNIIDDAKAILSGMLSPTIREEYLGQAEIREVFNITRVGKVAGCMVKIGSVKRGAKVRLLRDDVVIHEGSLKTLKRFKDEAKEVREGMECGMAFERYDDMRVGDIIECFDVVEEKRTL